MSVVLDIVSLVLLVLGSFFCITAGVGLIRMPDFFTRAHSASILDSMGAGLILFGLALQAPDYLVVIKLSFIFFFLLVTSLAAVHALAQAVNLLGINPRLAKIVQRLEKNQTAPDGPDTDVQGTDKTGTNEQGTVQPNTKGNEPSNS